MQYLRGYQQAYNLDKDIGLFTLYREQADYQNGLHNKLQLNHNHNISKSKGTTRNGHLSTNKIPKRISTLQSDRSKYVSERTGKDDEDIGHHLGQLRKIEELKNKASRIENQRIFTNRKNLTNNRSRNMITDGGEIKQKSAQRNQIYLSPRTKIQFHPSLNHIKNNLSQNIQSQPAEQIAINMKTSKKYLPSIKYKQKTNNSELNNLKLLKSHQQDLLQVKPILTESQNMEKNDSPICSTFVMISSKQYRMLSEKKEVPLLNILKKYSRNA